MRTLGIVVEYNPFHNGHHFHLQQSLHATGAEAVVAVMSGHFLQRGEPALVDKWLRTEMALRGGCDLVLELPVVYATHAAEWFAFGAIATLEATGIVDALCFGSESGDLEGLRKIARLLADEPPQFSQLLKQQLAQGSSYPAAYGQAVQAFLHARAEAAGKASPQAQEEASQEEAEKTAAEAAILTEPNNSLGLHYLIALERLQSSIVPFTIRREKAGYHEQDARDDEIASATAIRRMLTGQRSEWTEGLNTITSYVPASTLDVLKRAWERQPGLMRWDNLFPQLLHQLAIQTPQQLSSIHEMREGLEHRLLAALPKLEPLAFERYMELLKTKRYTRTKLQRALLATLLGHRKSDLNPEQLRSGIDYIRVLGFTAKGRQLLGRMRKTAHLPVLHSAARASGHRYLHADVHATAVYRLACPQVSGQALYEDYTRPPIQL